MPEQRTYIVKQINWHYIDATSEAAAIARLNAMSTGYRETQVARYSYEATLAPWEQQRGP
jgi:hypothetical protein